MNAPSELLTILNARSKDLNRQKYAYELGTPGQFGLDVVVNEDPDVDESSMSFILPFADGKRRDGVGDLLEVGGINCERHQKNPVSLLDHGKQVLLPIGKCEDPATGAYTVEIDPVSKIARARVFIYQGKGLANTEPAKENEHALLCAQIFDLWAKRFIRAGSIGYQVVAGRELGPDYETGTPKGVHLLNVLMLECSTVVMPANMDTVKGLRSPADLAQEVLCMGAVCGKPLSPVLVKSFSAFAPEKKVMLGWEGKSETVPVPLDNIPDTKIPPPEWKPGVGAEKSLSATTALILGALSAGTMGWTLGKLMGWLSDHGVDEAEAQTAIMDLQKRGNLEVNGENIQKKELPRQEFKGFNFNAAVEAGLSGNWEVLNDMIQDSGKTRSQADSIVEALKLDMDVTSRSGEWSNDQNRRSLISSKLRKAGLKSLDSEKKAVDDPTADYRVVATGANGERILYRGPDKEIAYRLAYQAKKSDLYNSVVLHGEVTGPRRMKSLRGRYGKPQSKGLEVRFEWRENPSGTPWERRKIWVRDGGSERQMSFTDLAQQYGQEVAKRMISTSIRKGTSNWHAVPGVKNLPRQGTKSLDMSSVRKKYRPTKTLRRRLRKSVPGSSLVHVAPSDLNAAREMAEAKGLKFDHVGSVGGLSRVKLMGDDSGIDAVAQEFGKSVRGRKSLPLTGTKECGVQRESDGWYARFFPGSDGAPDYRQDMGPFESEQEATQSVKQKYPGLFVYRKGISRKDLPTAPIPARIVKQFLYGMLSRQQAVAELVAKAGLTREQAEAEIAAVAEDIRSKERKGIKSTGDTEFNRGVAARLSGEQQNDNPYPIGSEAADSWNSGWVGGQGKMMKKKLPTAEQKALAVGDKVRGKPGTGWAVQGKDGRVTAITNGGEFVNVRWDHNGQESMMKITDLSPMYGENGQKKIKDMSTRGSIDLDGDVRRQIDNTGQTLNYAKPGNGGHFLYFAPGTDIFKVRTALEQGGHTFKITGQAEGWVKPRAKSLKAKGKSMDNTDDVYMDDDPLAEASKDMGMNPEHPFSAQVLKRLHEKALEDLEEGDSWMSHLEHPEVKKFVQKHLEGKAAHLDEIEALHSKHHPDLPGLGDAETKDLDEEELGETEGELDAIGDELDDVVGDLDEEFDDTEEDKDLDTIDRDAVPADSASEDEPTPEEALEGMETADGVKHLRRQVKASGSAPIKPGDKVRVGGTLYAGAEGTVVSVSGEAATIADEGGDTRTIPLYLLTVIKGKSLSRRRVKSLKDEEFDEEFIGKRLRRKGIEEVEELTEDEKQLIRRKRMKRRMKSACPECGGEDCDCVKSMDGPPPEFTDQIDNGLEATGEKGLEDHEMAKVGEAAQFANELATSDALDEEKRMKAFHYHKTLEGMGQIEDLAAEQKSEFVGDPQFWQEEGAEAEHKDMGTEHPGAMAGSAEEAAVNGPAAEAQIPPAKSIHPHRQACKDASQFFGDTATTKDWGRPHQEHASVVAKALEEVAAAPINKPEPVTDEAVIEVGEMGEKSRRFLPRRKSLKQDIQRVLSSKFPGKQQDVNAFISEYEMETEDDLDWDDPRQSLASMGIPSQDVIAEFGDWLASHGKAKSLHLKSLLKRKGRTRRKSVDELKKEEEEAKALRKNLIEQQKQVKELRRMINGIGNMAR